MTPPLPDYLTEDELVEMSRRGKKFWYRQRCSRKIPFSKLGRVVLYRLEDVETFIAVRSFGSHHRPDLSSPAQLDDRI
jgi:hypothetical protein